MAQALTLTTVNIGAADPAALGHFYHRLLGFDVAVEEDGWVLLHDPSGGVGISVQHEPHYSPPVWPAGRGDPQMMMHLEIRVEDLATASAHAESCGATLAAYQPQDDVRVYLDPAGHPFCLWLG